MFRMSIYGRHYRHIIFTFNYVNVNNSNILDISNISPLLSPLSVPPTIPTIKRHKLVIQQL